MTHSDPSYQKSDENILQSWEDRKALRLKVVKRRPTSLLPRIGNRSLESKNQDKGICACYIQAYRKNAKIISWKNLQVIVSGKRGNEGEPLFFI